MKREEYIIASEIEYFTQILDHYPLKTNYIYDKTLPGLGASYGEIIYERHSIIMGVHTPFIVGKCTKHPEILGVMERVYIDDVIAYLNDNQFPIKKIICTPEAFVSKVKPAIEMHEHFNLYKDFFLLYDECDRLISDINYRGAVALPMYDFFEFENKAMISATPVMPSDPRFDEHGFTYLKIKPDYNYQRDLKLIHTNNVLESLSKYLKSLNGPCFIFFNSTDGIHSIIEKLGMKQESSVFCGAKSVTKLKRVHQFGKTYVDLGKFTNYNYITSRFYSAVDFDLPEDANVIIITDLFFAEHSIVNPFTDVIQIQGRFRIDKEANKKIEIKRRGFKTLAHITNINPALPYMSKSESESFLSGAIEVVTKLIKMLKTMDNPGGKDALEKAIQATGYQSYLDEKGDPNYFMKDNFIEYEYLKESYTTIEKLYARYAKSGYFNVDLSHELYAITDSDKLSRTNSDAPHVLLSLIEQLNKLKSRSDGMFDLNFMDTQKELIEIEELNPFLYAAFETLGYEKIVATNGVKSNIKKALKDNSNETFVNQFEELRNRVYDRMTAKRYSKSDTKNLLQNIFREFNITYTVKPSDINKFFKVTHTTIKGNVKAFNIEGKNSENNLNFISKIFNS